MPQPERNTRIAFKWEQIIKAVLRMTNLFKELFLKSISSQFQGINLTVGQSSIVCICFVFDVFAFTVHLEYKFLPIFDLITFHNFASILQTNVLSDF